ncbi:ABC-2 type transport system permease protein [Amycolatopsis tolypomycina]|uniref:ABC-2 type transport system permease protein n=1 Tax=Amycolatopsis tolypomycina TaxID=208445 RepID=A0A1H4ZTF1_9PSEU|nr:ABC transporter permease [Amycolatopsis tolypomycina]SED32630.1 ABC-2 type transport system permease protein [Amycolatopsis tolypomycina]
MTGTGALLRLVLRRDRLLMPLWIVGLALAPVGYLSSIKAAYPDALARQHFYDLNASSATFVVRNGPLYGSSLGNLLAWQCGFVPVVVGLIALLTVVRHTRTEEEAGRRELTGATVVGRHAGLAAAVLATCGACLVFGLLAAFGVAAQGVPFAGALALGLGFSLAGWVFAGVGAVAAQLTWGASGARGLGIGVLVPAFLLRAAGDSSASAGWPAWLSPIGWAHRLRPFAGEQWWVLALGVVATGFAVAVAVALAARRDLGAALLPARLGRSGAQASLRSPLALAWRLQRGTLLVWTVCLGLVGLLMGGVAQNVADMMRDNEAVGDLFSRMGGGAVLDAYLAGTMTLFGLAASGYAVQATLKLRAEEAAGRAEPVLATAVGRVGWALGHLAFAFLGPAVVLAVTGWATGLAYGSGFGLVPAALAQLPAVWVLTGLAALLIGFVPRYSAVAWGLLAAFLLLSLVGTALRWSSVVLGISPFQHLPRLPGGTFSAGPALWLAAIALVAGAAGLFALRRRDMPAG